MVNSGADICLAFPIGTSKGTRHCMSLVEQANIPLINITEESADAIDEFFSTYQA